MDYEQKYKEALEMARKAYYSSETPYVAKTWLLTMFPTIAESTDERIRKGIIEFVKQSSEVLDKQNQKDMIDWLEKHSHMLDPDKVIEWLENKQPSVGVYDKFKKDFGL